MVDIISKYVGNVLIGYYGYYKNLIVFLDLSMLDFYPNSKVSPAVMSWEGFPLNKKFYIKIHNKGLSTSMSIEDVGKIMEPHLTRGKKSVKIRKE